MPSHFHLRPTTKTFFVNIVYEFCLILVVYRASEKQKRKAAAEENNNQTTSDNIKVNMEFIFATRSGVLVMWCSEVLKRQRK